MRLCKTFLNYGRFPIATIRCCSNHNSAHGLQDVIQATTRDQKAYKVAAEVMDSIEKSTTGSSSASAVEKCEREVTKILEKSISDTTGSQGSETLDFACLKIQGNQLYSKKDYVGALEKYTEAAEKAVTDEDKGAVYHNRGLAYEEMNKNEAALEEYTKALDLIPDYYKVLRRRAKLNVKMEHYEKAQMDLKNILVIEKTKYSEVTHDTAELVSSVVIKLGCAMALETMANYAKNPSAPRKEEINILFRSFICDPVSLIWNGKLAVLHSENADTGYLAAVKALKAKDYEPIFALCEDEIKNTESAYLYDAYLLRGTLRYLWGYGQETLADLEMIVNAPTSDKRLNNKLRSNAALKMALFYRHRTDDGDKLHEYFDSAERFWAENCDVYHHCAMMMVESDDPVKAYEMLCQGEKAYKGDGYPTFFKAFKLAVSYCMASEDSKVEDMEAIFSKLQELESSFDTPECYDVYANALLLKGKTVEAVELYEKAIAFCSDYPSFHLKKALAYYWEDDEPSKTECLEELKKVMEIDSQYNVLYFHIGSMEIRMGNYEKGFKDLRRCLELTRNIDEVAERARIMIEYEMHIELCQRLKIPAW